MKSLANKIAKVQQEIGVLSKDAKNPFFKSTYLTLNELLANLKPLEEKHKLTTVQIPSHVDGKPSLKIYVYDLESDESLEDNSILPESLDAQKMGSAITYFRRYQLTALYKIQAEDDDANSASKAPSVSSSSSSDDFDF